MKKSYSLIISILLTVIAVVLGSCEISIFDTPGNVTECDSNIDTAFEESVYEYGLYESVIVSKSNDGSPMKEDCELGNGKNFKKNNMPDTAITVYGKEYVGSYTGSEIRLHESYTVDRYSDLKNHVEFGLRDNDGKIVYFSVNSQSAPIKPYPEYNINTENDAVAVAKLIAGEYVGDIERYLISVEKKYDTNGKITYYTVSFNKEIQGYSSSDRIVVGFTPNGNLSRVYVGDIGAFENIDFNVDETKLNQSVRDKIEQACKNAEFTMHAYNVTQQKLILTPEGYVCMSSYVTVSGTDEYGYTYEGAILNMVTVLKT